MATYGTRVRSIFSPLFSQELVVAAGETEVIEIKSRPLRFLSITPDTAPVTNSHSLAINSTATQYQLDSANTYDLDLSNVTDQKYLIFKIYITASTGAGATFLVQGNV